MMRSERVVIVSGSYGAGHDAAAAAICRQLQRAGLRAEVLDIVDAYPLGLGRLLRSLYLLQLKLLPQTWGWLLSLLGGHEKRPGVARVLMRLLAWLPSQRLADAIDDDVVAVVSTHPFASASLGRLRDRGLLDAPVATYLTDPSVHAFWVHPGVDAHLAIYPEAARQARRHGAAAVTLVRPAIDQGHTPWEAASSPDRILRDLGIPTDRPVVLVVGGSEGVGALPASATDVAATGLATVVVACGRNEALWDRMSREPNLMALPWVDHLRDVVGAADCVVQNAGGFTVLEALAAGTPVVSYRCLPGHGTDNAEALEADRLAVWPRDEIELREALVNALATTTAASRWAPRPFVSDVIAGSLAEAIPA